MDTEKAIYTRISDFPLPFKQAKLTRWMVDTSATIRLLTDCRRQPLTDHYITVAMKKRRSNVETLGGAIGLGGEGEQSIPRRVAGVVRQAAGGMCRGDYRSAAWDGFRSVRRQPT